MDVIKPTTVDEYINQLPENGKIKAKEIRAILFSVAPEAKQGLKWGKPVFESDTILFAYSSHKSHISFIPTGPALKLFLEELKAYKVSKDSVQFSLNESLPEELIRKIAVYRKADVEERGAKWYY